MATTGTRDDDHAAFWDVAEPFLGSGRLIEGTMMGQQCLRVTANDQFVATVHRETGNLVVKLPKARVAELIDAGEGLSFAPATKVFKEWVAIPVFNEARWTSLIHESVDFVSTK
jgi:hypothetical protein